MQRQVAVVLGLVGVLLATCTEAQNFTVTPLSCTGTVACSLEALPGVSMTVKPKSGVCPTGSKVYSKNTTLCEPSCATGYAATYGAGKTKSDPPTVTCTQAACAAAAVGCGTNCLPKLAELGASATIMCSVFTGRLPSAISACKGGAAPVAACNKGQAVCMLASALTCPSGSSLTADQTACAKCTAGTVLLKDVKTPSCAPPCTGAYVNGTCYGNCTTGSKLSGGKCLANCLTGETEVDIASCKTKAGKSYAKATASTAKVLSTPAKPLQQTAPTRAAPTSICPKGMRYCNSGKCAADILGADGCMLFANLAAAVYC